MKCLLIGNYGVGNLGDEALKEYFLTRFPEVQWTVLTVAPRGPSEVPRLPFGLRSLLLTPWWMTLKALRASDAVVFGGGSLFTDVESVYACLLWWWHALIARLFGKPVVLAFQGIGPFTTRVGEWCARSVISAASFISVRDEESAERARVRVVVSFDPVLSLLEGSRTTGNAIALIPRANSGDDFLAQAMTAVRSDPSASVTILSMQPDSTDEQSVCRRLKDAIGSRVVIRSVRSLRELSAALSSCFRVITARYHGALAAATLGLPMEIVPQHAGDKLDALRTLMTMQGIAQLQSRVEIGERELRKYLNML